MSKTQIKRLLREQIKELWGKGRTALVDANYAEHVIDHMPVEGQPTGRAALKDVVTAFRKTIPDLEMELHHVMAAGDHGIDIWTARGHVRADHAGASGEGVPVHFSGIDMVRVADGRITDLWHVEEMAKLAAQMAGMTDDFGAPNDNGDAPAPAGDVRHPGANAVVPGESGFTPKERRNLAIARRHIEEIWAKGRSELCWELYHPDVIDHNPAPGQKPGIPGIIDVLLWLREAVPDLAMDIRCYVIEEDWIADRWVMTGTHTGAPLMGIAATGGRFRIDGMDVARLDADGRITDIWHCEDFRSLVAQVTGRLPRPITASPESP